MTRISRAPDTTAGSSAETAKTFARSARAARVASQSALSGAGVAMLEQLAQNSRVVRSMAFCIVNRLSLFRISLRRFQISLSFRVLADTGSQPEDCGNQRHKSGNIGSGFGDE